MNSIAFILGALTVGLVYWWWFRSDARQGRPIRIRLGRDLLFTFIFWSGASWVWSMFLSLFW